MENGELDSLQFILHSPIEWRMENGEWRMENGEWRMENGEWRMENGEWRVENGEWRMEKGCVGTYVWVREREHGAHVNVNSSQRRS